jgi:AcrR family transcriptional regulator
MSVYDVGGVPVTIAPPPARLAARRQQLLDAAVAIFARKGYRGAAISDIIAQADVARGTFYLYFDSKEEIFLAIVDDFHDRIRRMLDEPDPPMRLAEHNGRAVLQRSFRRWLLFFAAHRDAATVILKEATSIDPRFEASLARLRELARGDFAARFRRVQARGLVNPSMSPDLVAHLQMGMLDAAVDGYILRDAEVDIEALAQQLAAFAWDGIHP